MKYRQQVPDEPGGNPVPFLGVRVKRKSDGVTLTSLVTDANGFVTYEASGHSEPFYFETTNTVGGPRFWLSDETMPAGSFSPAELPHLLRALGDGVLPNDVGFGLTIVGTTLTLGSGVSLAAGYPVVIYDDVTLNVTRPPSGTRIDRIVARVYPAGASTDPGYADVALVAGTVDSGAAPALVQTANEWHVALWRVTVPAAGALTAVDDRVAMLAGYLSRPATVSEQARSSSVSTSSAGGEALAGLSVSLVLPTSATYDIDATLLATQSVSVVGGPEQLTWEGSFGSYGAAAGQFNLPFGVAIGAADTVVVADTSNNRLQVFNSAGVHQATVAVGNYAYAVAADSAGNLYVVSPVYPQYIVLRKYAFPAYSLAYVGSINAGAGHQPGQIATDNTHLYISDVDGPRVYKCLCSTGVVVGSWGGAGSGNGQFQAPYGVVTDGTSVWVSDLTLLRVQRFTTAGVYVSQFGDSSIFMQPYGMARDSAGQLLVADAHRILRFSSDGVALDSAGSYGSGDGNLNFAHALAVDSAGDVLVADTSNHRISRWQPVSVGTPGGYGSVAVEIDGNLGAYLGPGQRTCGTGNAHTHSVAGPGTVLVNAYGKATADTMTLRSACLSATAIPRG